MNPIPTGSLVKRLSGLSTATTATAPIAALKDYAYGQDRALLSAIEQQVRAALTNDADRSRLEAQFIALLASEATFDAKQFVCRQLRLIGSAQSAPVLAQLLTDPRLSSMARYALESMPIHIAGPVLRNALKSTRGEFLIGVMNSLSRQRDPQAVPLLKSWIHFADQQISGAAIAALGRIGSTEAYRALRGLKRNLNPQSADALLLCADAFQRRGETDQAAEIYQDIYQHRQMPLPTKLAALRGLLQSAPQKAQRFLDKMARDPEAQVQAWAASLKRSISKPGRTP